MSKSKNKKKSSQMIIRVEKHEKDQFQDICKDMDTSAARELRRFMRDFVAAHSPAAVPANAAETPLPVQVEAEAEPEAATTKAPAQTAADEPLAEAVEADIPEATTQKRTRKK